MQIQKISELPEVAVIDSNIYFLGVDTSGVRAKVRRVKMSRIKSFLNAASVATRNTSSFTTPQLANKATYEGVIDIARGAILYKCQFNYPARLRLYDSNDDLIADRNRSSSIEPSANSGVLTEEISNFSQLITLIPDILILNKQASPNISFPFALTNLDQPIRAIQFILSYLIIEN